MTFNKIINGKPVSEEQNSLWEISLNNAGIARINQLQDRTVTRSNDGVSPLDEAYVSAIGRNSSVVTAESSALFDTNKYESFSEESYVVIEATSISSVSDFAINNCIIKPFDIGKWVLYCTTGTDEVKRAQIYKTLFYGTNGTNPRASSTYITGITSLKTSVARDVGKQAHLITGSTSTTDNIDTNITFSNTTTNTNCSSWSYLQANNSQSQDRFGTDRTADENDNPANARVEAVVDAGTIRWRIPTGTIRHDFNHSGYVGGQTKAIRVLILCVGDVTKVDEATRMTTTLLDFSDDNSIPLFTEASNVLGTIVHTIPSGTFGDLVSSGYAVAKIVDWEDGASLQWKATNATEDTGWQDFNINGNKAYAKISAFTALTAEPDEFIIKLIPKTTTPTAGVPSIAGSSIQLL